MVFFVNYYDIIATKMEKVNEKILVISSTEQDGSER